MSWSRSSHLGAPRLAVRYVAQSTLPPAGTGRRARPVRSWAGLRSTAGRDSHAATTSSHGVGSDAPTTCTVAVMPSSSEPTSGALRRSLEQLLGAAAVRSAGAADVRDATETQGLVG